MDGLGGVALRDLENPKLYDVAVRLDNGDEYQTRIGFREGKFTPAGFLLNGKHVKLRGLNRHQTYPYVGGAMPARVQRRDALVLKRELHWNIARTSHYPQSPAFLDGCDEIGLLVFEEIPGWQHIGNEAWQDVAVRNVGEMVRRDWNHPSIVLWGVRINESHDKRRILYAHKRTGARAGRRAADCRCPVPVRFAPARRRLHNERFRLPAEEAESSPVLKHRVQWSHVLDQALRQRLARRGACDSPCPRARPACGR